MNHCVKRSELFNLLMQLNISCNKDDFNNIYFENVPKFKVLLENIDLDAYNLDYIQNRFILIKQRNIPLEKINQIIFCPFNTKHNIKLTECEIVSFNYYEKPRNSYLKRSEDEFSLINERFCIKGCMETALLNAITLYMLNNHLFKPETMIVFGLKNYDTLWTSMDVLEYLQNHGLTEANNNLNSIIDLDYTSAPKGLPKKDYMGCIEIGVKRVPSLFNYIDDVTHINSKELKEEFNYTLKLNKNLKLLYDQDFLYHKELSNYYNIDILSKFRLNAFTDIKPNNKFTTFFMEKPFLVEWNSIIKFINLLMDFNKV